MHFKIETLASLCLFTIMSITLADSDGFNMASTKAQMATMRRSMPIYGKTYVLVTFQKGNWFRAAHICKYNDMELASVDSPAEQSTLLSLLDGSGVDGPFWLSGNDLGSAKSWYWLSNGRPIENFNWNDGEPNNYLNRNERCIILTPKYRWNDVPCDQKYDFICEAKHYTLRNYTVHYKIV